MITIPHADDSKIVREQIDDFLLAHFTEAEMDVPSAAEKLIESMRYSIFSGGKRFRPLVSALVADALNFSREQVLPFAAAIELVHTYSLIHDDLPCMDNDDLRRGKPTNHKVYGEALALLAGDALLTEAFQVVAQYYGSNPALCVDLIQILSGASGMRGMISGQVIDILSQKTFNHEQFEEMHRFKTGKLIHAAVVGAAKIASASETQEIALSEFGEQLGFAFQLADDILDHKPGAIETSGFPNLIGLDETKKLLKHTANLAIQKLSAFGARAAGLKDLVEFNSTRLE